MKKISIVIIFLTLIYNFSYAQEEEVNPDETQKDSEFVFGADLVSRYLWRGLDLGSAAAVQPGFSWNMGGFSVGTWGSYSLDGNFAEADLFIAYNYKFVTLTINDYFFPIEDFNVNNEYFNYKSDETSHLFEAMLQFTGVEKFPFGFLIATTFYGADLDANGDNIYSTYLELSYPLSINKVELDFFIGAVVNDQPNAYADGAGVINMGFKASKPIKISDEYSMGTFFSMVVNPKYESIYLIFGLSF